MSIEYGLKSFKWKGSGDSSLTSLGKIAAGTAKFITESPSVNKFFAAQNPAVPAISIKENNGLTKVQFSLMEIDADVLVKLFGGTATGTAPDKSYAAPRESVDVHGEAELVTDTDLKITIPKASLLAVFNWDLSRTSVSNIDVTLEVELPDLETDMPYTIARV